VIVLLAAALLLAAEAQAHDPSTYGGVFRSRDLGGTWLNADVGLFLNAALVVAADPEDPNDLLLGTDTGLLGSTNGGRSWAAEGGGAIAGPVFAVAFSPDGRGAICVAPGGVFRLRNGTWERVSAPRDAAPARGALYLSAGRVYLLGRGGLYVSDDSGGNFRRAPGSPPPEAAITSLAAAKGMLVAVVDRKLMVNADGTWRALEVAGAPVDTATADRIGRLWAASADRIYMSDDAGRHWQPIGNPLPEPQTEVRGIAADAAGETLVVTTHRGLYRSVDRGLVWELKENNLPVHLEAGPLARDAKDPTTLFAVYSLMPYPAVWQTALQGGTLLARVDVIDLAGGTAFLLLLFLSGGLLVVWLRREPAPRGDGNRQGPPP